MKDYTKWASNLVLTLLVTLMPSMTHAATIDLTPDTPEQITATQIVRLSLIDLRYIEEPDANDYMITEAILSLASELEPENLDFLNRRIQAAVVSEDQNRLLDLTRQLLRLQPDNTIAALRLISARIAKLQTAELRMAAYERFLGTAGQRLPASIRSRLALDAALLSREMGNDDIFASYLEQSLILDQTNKDAALLSATTIATLSDDPITRLESLDMLLLADPLDPNVHFSIARELSANGAFKNAQRFFDNGIFLYRAAEKPLDEQTTIGSLVLNWYNNGPASTAKKLTDDLFVQRLSATKLIEDLRKTGRSTEGTKTAEETRLPMPLERILMLTAESQEDPELLNLSMTDYVGSIDEIARRLSDPTRDGAALTSNEIFARVWKMTIDLQTLRFWLNVQTDAVEQTWKTVRMPEDARVKLFPLLPAWQAMRFGDANEAIKLFTAHLGKDTMARIGLALALEKAGRTDDAVEQLMTHAREHPRSLIGAWSYWKANRLLGLTDGSTSALLPLSDNSAQLEAMADRIPSWIDDMVQSPMSFVSLNIEPLAREFGTLDRIQMAVRLTNISQIPLGVGPDRPINSRLLFAPRLEIHSSKIDSNALPEPALLNQRLVLKPNQSVLYTIWPNAGRTGQIMEKNAGFLSRISWRVLQGYLISTEMRTFRSGPGCLTLDTGLVIKRPLPQIKLDFAQLVSLIDTAPEDQLPQLVATARVLITNSILTDENTLEVESRRRAIAQACAKRYPSVDKLMRAMMVAMLPHSNEFVAMTSFDNATRQERDPFVLPLVLITRITDANDPLLTTALDLGDDRVSRVANGVQARLAAGNKVYAMLGLGSQNNLPEFDLEKTDPMFDLPPTELDENGSLVPEGSP